MHIDILTLFPGMFNGPLTESIIQRAQNDKLVEISIHNLRNWGIGTHKQVDDEPYGGGAGMVMRVDVISKAIEEIKKENTHSIYLSARGETLKQEKVETLSNEKNLLLLCGHYEGIDQRIMEGGWIDEEISIGNYVLTGGELPAMVLVDSVCRHIPGVLGKEESALEESFSKALDRKREYPHYTRPDEFDGLKVPDVLLSGHHAEIEKWRKENSL
ncbi:tRNA (guanosine(37)-N1)-methyltransferase TrmD [Candidatus Peribacteria bacterium]|jgi:tRNA (guanine37-N1)-methyltransferase|nr:tRNA (guanosine(37)-N1)-methyltransferase TrmD [Candidatus Peribacteria bacterium]MBT4021518.1 tRNA (guanosine(37)-N1)-methyltransferase TrmD [Candidatus Peribacteria bacterium]MBT4240996.1 tRNA (guanosine(37)-N1)-methyltransferase TrmD [Candidatus Peribacteria bacterium]MBT4473989.1 tRNA (guanosine(37)-N1)-methyltransferase TrmD [Candidatus Peribacteria bacterium]